MSRDYGLLCETCKRAFFGYDLSEHEIQTRVLPYINELIRFYMAYIQLPHQTDIELSAYWETQIRELLQWLTEHRGHKISMVDEYDQIDRR